MTDFRESQFRVVNLGDCTALFLFFERCDFSGCYINAESVGFSYGLTGDNLNSLNLIYLGRKQRKPKDQRIIESLVSSYWDRKWYVGACVLELNFDHSTPLISIRRVAQSLYVTAKGGVIPDWDEWRFFIRVLRQIHTEQRLPLLGLWLIIATLHKIADLSKLEMRLASASPAAELVLADAQKLLLTILDELAPALSLVDSSFEVQLDLVLSRRPRKSISDLIPRKAYEAFGQKHVTLIEGREGSWFETWQMSLGALAAIQVSLVAINGVMAQLLKAITQAKRFRKELTPKRSKVPAAKKISSAKTTRQIVLQSQILLPVILQADLESSRLRSESLSLESLKRLDVLLIELNKLKDRELDDFQAYSAKRIEKVSVRRAPNRKPKRGRRERQISA